MIESSKVIVFPLRLAKETSNKPASTEKRARRTAPKVKTGCITCRFRRVKCDEAKPCCLRCTSTGRKCDGYAKQPEEPKFVMWTHTSAGSLIKADKSLNALAGSPEEARYLEYYFHRAGPRLAGNLDSDLWMQIVLQLSFEEPAIRHATMAISYLYEKDMEYREPGFPIALPAQGERFFLKHYNEAISCLVARMQANPKSLEISLVTCILFICLEILRKKDCTFAFAHLKSGLDIVAGLRNRSRLGLPSPPASASPESTTTVALPESLESTTITFVEDHLVPAFARMGMTALLFGHTVPQLYPSAADAIPTLPRTFTTLRDARLILVDVTNLTLMFIAYDNKKYTAEGLSPADIAHYARLLALLADWSTTFEASAPAICTTPSLRESGTVLRILHSVASIWLACSTDETEMAYDAYLPAFTRILTLASRVLEPNTSKSLTEDSAKKDSDSDASSTFTFEMSLVAPLYFIVHRCRDPHTRRTALALLRAHPRREGLWETRRCAANAARIILREETGIGDAGEWPRAEVRIHDAVFQSEEAPIFNVMFFAVPGGKGTDRVMWRESVDLRREEWGVEAGTRKMGFARKVFV